jgi:hypothetical protein
MYRPSLALLIIDAPVVEPVDVNPTPPAQIEPGHTLHTYVMKTTDNERSTNSVGRVLSYEYDRGDCEDRVYVEHLVCRGTSQYVRQSSVDSS